VSEQISLDARGLEAALAVLRREQTAYLPSSRQAKLYRAFNVSAFALAAVFVLWFALAMNVQVFEENDTMLGIAAVILTLAAIAFSLSTLILFVFNAGLMRKLYRHAQLRQRLKLAYYFQPAFTAQRRVRRFGNLVTMLIIGLGVWITLSGLSGIFVSVFMLPRGPQSLLFGLGSLALVGAGLGLGALHFVRRGKERLEVVQRLQDMLSKQAADPATGDGATVSPEEYNAIARIERAQIIRDRASSIVSARREAEGAGYVCQSSRQMREAKSRLAPEVLAKVEGTIEELLRNPVPAGGSVPVAGTPLRIQFDVDPGRHLVRLHGVTET